MTVDRRQRPIGDGGARRCLSRRIQHGRTEPEIAKNL
jgi:hypothetical protein